MRDGIEETATEIRRPKLDYPFEAGPTPGAGDAVEVAPGVLWLRMPLGGALQFINVWAIDDGDGWCVVDTGMQTRDTSQAWRTAFKDALGGRPITRVIVTHLHPDHIGLAGWMTRKFQCRLWMTRLEYLQCRMLVADTGREAPEDGMRFYRAAGWDEDALENYRARFGGFGKAIYQLPDSYRRLDDKEEFRIGAHTWRIVTGNGHSPDHACLYCPELKLLISGDQVLPRISSNVSVFPTEPDADPLTEWLNSCRSFMPHARSDQLVLPGHKLAFTGLPFRLTQMVENHESALSRLLDHLAMPRTANQCFQPLFRREIGPSEHGLALVEAIAHLNCLLRRGLVFRSLSLDGAWVWERL